MLFIIIAFAGFVVVSVFAGPLIGVAAGIVIAAFAGLTIRPRNAVAATPVVGTPDFVNNSGRQHTDSPAQTWASFLHETFRKKRNSGANVKLGSGFEIGIVGESFHVSELQRLRAADIASGVYRSRFQVYLIHEPENPYSRNGNCVRVESAAGKTIGHFSVAHANAYAPIFNLLGEQKRVAVCNAVAVGGSSSKPNIGVWLKIGHPDWLAQQIAEAQRPPKLRVKRVRAAPPADQPF